MSKFKLSLWNNDLSEEDEFKSHDYDFIRTRYVKEFIRLLKEEFPQAYQQNKIDELTGDLK